MNLRCRNIKINVILAQSLDLGLIPIKDFTITNKRTCFTLRHVYLDCVITIYKHSPTSLHITGIKSPSVITEVFELLSNVMNTRVISSKINNSMFCGKLDHHVKISYIVREIERNCSFYNCHFCEEIFPALFIKPTIEKRKEGVPTILLFPNGSFIIMGAKNVIRVKHAFMFLTHLTKKYT